MIQGSVLFAHKHGSVTTSIFLVLVAVVFLCLRRCVVARIRDECVVGTLLRCAKAYFLDISCCLILYAILMSEFPEDLMIYLCNSGPMLCIVVIEELRLYFCRSLVG